MRDERELRFVQNRGEVEVSTRFGGKARVGNGGKINGALERYGSLQQQLLLASYGNPQQHNMIEIDSDILVDNQLSSILDPSSKLPPHLKPKCPHS